MTSEPQSALELHPVLAAAARGELPSWAVVNTRRREHVGRVSALMQQWGVDRGLAGPDVSRWAAAGLLHDALRNEAPRRLRRIVPASLQDLPGRILHGPAASVLLRQDGVDDAELLAAVSYHTIGHPDLQLLGRALCAADFLEPGRERLEPMRQALRSRMPAEVDAVVRLIFRSRLQQAQERRAQVHPLTRAFLARLAAERHG